MRDRGLELALGVAGGVSALARIIGVSQPAISGWKRVPPDRVLAIEAATGIPRTTLRPDLYAEADLPIPDNLDEIDAARADLYALLANLLWQAPDAVMLRRLSATVAGEGPLAEARRALAEAAHQTDAKTVEREHFNLLIGVTGGEILPYASYYLTGFVHERPLAEVRVDLARLGFVRTEGLSEPEDHIAFLFEIMAALIRSGQDTADFFHRHIERWSARLFADMARAESANVYRSVARLAAALIDLETQALALSA